MSHYRYITDCLTGIRHWRFYSSVSRPERPLWFPCAKAALILPPLLGVPGAAFTPPPPAWSQGGFYFPQGWGGWFAPYLPYEYLPGAEASLPTPAGSVPLLPGEGLVAVPGTNIVSVSETPPYNVPPLIHTPPVDNVNIPPNKQVPEPATIAIVAVGAGAAILNKRRRG